MAWVRIAIHVKKMGMDMPNMGVTGGCDEWGTHQVVNVLLFKTLKINGLSV